MAKWDGPVWLTQLKSALASGFRVLGTPALYCSRKLHTPGPHRHRVGDHRSVTSAERSSMRRSCRNRADTVVLGRTGTDGSHGDGGTAGQRIGPDLVGGGCLDRCGRIGGGPALRATLWSTMSHRSAWWRAAAIRAWTRRTLGLVALGGQLPVEPVELACGQGLQPCPVRG